MFLFEFLNIQIPVFFFFIFFIILVFAALYACLDAHNTILDKYHYMLYYLAPAMVCCLLAMLDD